jgi:hypothetical protein
MSAERWANCTTSRGEAPINTSSDTICRRRPSGDEKVSARSVRVGLDGDGVNQAAIEDGAAQEFNGDIVDTLQPARDHMGLVALLF